MVAEKVSQFLGVDLLASLVHENEDGCGATRTLDEFEKSVFAPKFKAFRRDITRKSLEILG